MGGTLKRMRTHADTHRQHAPAPLPPIAEWRALACAAACVGHQLAILATAEIWGLRTPRNFQTHFPGRPCTTQTHFQGAHAPSNVHVHLPARTSQGARAPSRTPHPEHTRTPSKRTFQDALYLAAGQIPDVQVVLCLAGHQSHHVLAVGRECRASPRHPLHGFLQGTRIPSPELSIFPSVLSNSSAVLRNSSAELRNSFALLSNSFAVLSAQQLLGSAQHFLHGACNVLCRVCRRVWGSDTREGLGALARWGAC